MLAAKLLHKSNRAVLAHLDAILDEALQETFPASDPVAVAIELEPSKLATSEDRQVHAGQPRTYRDSRN